jgi:superfamily II DNA or RNA helicase
MDNNTVPSPGAILEGPFWAERVRVVASRWLGRLLEIEAEGLRTGRFYRSTLTDEQMATVVVHTGLARFSLDAPSRVVRLAVEAKRIRLAHLFDPLYAVSVSQVDPLPHQLDAVYSRLLRLPNVRFLLADDPGAGKTIMAGLLMRELKQRGLVQRTLVVVPKALTDQWRREMYDRFGEVFEVVNRDTFDATYGLNPWEGKDQCITSIDFAKQESIVATLRDTHWDLVIVDEAHKMAAYRYGADTKKTDRYQLGEVLSQNGGGLLFLTATPHKGDPENFRLLLALLDQDLYATTGILGDAVAVGDNPNFLRRMKEDMRDFDGRPLFPPRHVKTLPYDLSGPETRLYEDVTRYVEVGLGAADRAGNRNVGLALTILQRRLASSVYAIQRSLERRRDRLQRLLDEALAGANLQAQVQLMPTYSEEDLEDMTEAETWQVEQQMLESLTLARSPDELRREIEELHTLVKVAREVEQLDCERKLEELRRVIHDEEISRNQEKLLVFTEHKDTLDYLTARLRSWGFTITNIHGSMRLPDRVQAERDFRERDQVMVATEAAGEGINLQFCKLMVNWDIPWNPNRLEQRMGRIHRYGQTHEVHIYNLVAQNTREGQVLIRLLDKLEVMREHLGSDRVYDVVGDVMEVNRLRLDQLIREAITQRRSMEEILRDIDVITDPETVRRIRQDITLEALCTRHIDMSRIVEETRESRERRLMPEFVERFFREAFEYLGGRMRETDKGYWRVEYVPADLRNVPAAKRYGPVQREYRRLTFYKDLAKRDTQSEFIGPAHPLFEAVLEAILARSEADLFRGAVFADPDAREPYLLWFLEGAVRDGTGEDAGRRLFALRQTTSGFHELPPGAIVDLPPSDEPLLAPDELRGLIDEDAAVTWATEQLMLPYLEEITDRRQREVEVVRKYVERSLNHLILESEEKLAKYYERQDKGENMAIAIQQEQTHKRTLIERRDGRLQHLRLEGAVSLTTPSVIGVVAVVPGEVPADVDPGAMRRDDEVERIAMEASMAFEREHHREPEDVSARKFGYDIRSRDSDGGVRYIEVKGRADEGDIVLTENEWTMARRLGADYWLYVVTGASDAVTAEVHPIQDPASKLEPEPQAQIVRYRVTRDDWRQAEERHGSQG